jgi:hypothetical protein
VRILPPLPICDDAEFSNDDTERLWLSRKVADSGPVGLIIGLNPSTAGATLESNDHTIKKETEFSRRWGWGGFWKGNLFTAIETYSQNLKNMTFRQACGEHGSDVLEAMLPHAHEIVVCWGAAVPQHMSHRISSVCTRIRMLKQPGARVLCFGTTKNGHPVHPLYLSYDTPMVEFELPIERASRR